MRTPARRRDDPETAPIECFTCFHFGTVGAKPLSTQLVAMGCTNKDNPWYDEARKNTDGYLCPDHPENVKLLEQLK